MKASVLVRYSKGRISLNVGALAVVITVAKVQVQKC